MVLNLVLHRIQVDCFRAAETCIGPGQTKNNNIRNERNTFRNSCGGFGDGSVAIALANAIIGAINHFCAGVLL